MRDYMKLAGFFAFCLTSAVTIAVEKNSNNPIMINLHRSDCSQNFCVEEPSATLKMSLDSNNQLTLPSDPNLVITQIDIQQGNTTCSIAYDKTAALDLRDQKNISVTIDANDNALINSGKNSSCELKPID